MVKTCASLVTWSPNLVLVVGATWSLYTLKYISIKFSKKNLNSQVYCAFGNENQCYFEGDDNKVIPIKFYL